MCLFFLPVKQISQVLVHISCTFNLQLTSEIIALGTDFSERNSGGLSEVEIFRVGTECSIRPACTRAETGDGRLALQSPKNDLKALDNISHQGHQHVKGCIQFQFRKSVRNKSRSCPTCDKTSDLIRLISRATSHLGTTPHSKESEQKRDNTGRSCFFVLSAIARSSARSCMQCLAAALNKSSR